MFHFYFLLRNLRRCHIKIKQINRSTNFLNFSLCFLFLLIWRILVLLWTNFLLDIFLLCIASFGRYSCLVEFINLFKNSSQPFVKIFHFVFLLSTQFRTFLGEIIQHLWFVLYQTHVLCCCHLFYVLSHLTLSLYCELFCVF